MTVSNLSTGMRPGVCLSTSRPTVPYEGQMIYETDTDLVYLWNGTAWIETVSALTKAPRGVMGKVSRTSGDIVLAGATTDIVGMSITFTGVAGRQYKASWHVNGSKNASDRDGTSVTFCQSDNTVLAQINMVTMGTTNIGINFSGFHIFTSTGSATFKLRAMSFSGNLTLFSSTGYPLNFVIEDIGAV